MSNDHTAKVTGLMGSTGCGKTYRLKKELARPARKRTLIWSPKEAIDRYQDLYPGTVICRNANQVLAVMKRAGKGAFHIVFVPTLNRAKDEPMFGAVCKMAMAAQNVTVVVDEAHTVTRASWAPDGWSELIMMGRGYGTEVFVLSQRPASVDKDFYSNMSTLIAYRVNFDDDAKTLAKSLRVPLADVMALRGFDSIERNTITGEIKKSIKKQ